MKKTVVIGASANTERYSNMAVRKLKAYGHEVVAIGQKAGVIEGIEIHTNHPEVNNVHTITMYVGQKNQPPLYDYIFSLHPERIIFNPGAENPELESLATAKGIEVTEACTLVLLSIGDY